MKKKQHVQKMLPPKREVVGIQGTGRRLPGLEWRGKDGGWRSRRGRSLQLSRLWPRSCHKSNRKPLSCLNLEVGMGNAVTGGDIGVLE